MATKIVRLCDECLERGVDVEATGNGPHEVGVDGRTFELDLCVEHSMRLLDIVAWASSCGIVTSSPKAPPSKAVRGRRAQHPNDDGVSRACPVKGCGVVVGSRPGLGVHASRAHGVGGIFALYDLAAALEAGHPLDHVDA